MKPFQNAPTLLLWDTAITGAVTLPNAPRYAAPLSPLSGQVELINLCSEQVWSSLAELVSNGSLMGLMRGSYSSVTQNLQAKLASSLESYDVSTSALEDAEFSFSVPVAVHTTATVVSSNSKPFVFVDDEVGLEDEILFSFPGATSIQSQIIETKNVPFCMHIDD